MNLQTAQTFIQRLIDRTRSDELRWADNPANSGYLSSIDDAELELIVAPSLVALLSDDARNHVRLIVRDSNGVQRAEIATYNIPMRPLVQLQDSILNAHMQQTNDLLYALWGVAQSQPKDDERFVNGLLNSLDQHNEG